MIILIISWKEESTNPTFKKIWTTIHRKYAQQVGGKKASVIGDIGVFLNYFSLSHSKFPKLWTDQSFTDYPSKKKKRQESQINNYLSILFHHDNKQMVLIFWRLIPEQLKTQQDINI